MTHGSLVPATSYKQNDQKENNNDDHHNNNKDDHLNNNTKKNKNNNNNDDNDPDDLVSAHLKSTIFNQKSKTWLNVWYRARCKVQNALSMTEYHRWVL